MQITHINSHINRVDDYPLLGFMHAIAINSLFMGIVIAKTPFTIGLFYAFIPIIFALSLNKSILKPRFDLIITIQLIYLFLHGISAFNLNVQNGMRECIQIVIVVIYYYLFTSYILLYNSRSFIKYSYITVLLITVYTIGWHLANGQYVRWKGLDAPKGVFSFLIIIIMVIFNQLKIRNGMLGLLLASVLILFSAERKAFIQLPFGPILLYGVRSYKLMLSLVAIIISIFFMYAVFEVPMVVRQVDSILFYSADEDVVDAATGDLAESGASLSNLQRQFAFEIGMELFRESPIFGIGTNSYKDYVDTYLSDMPKFLQPNIHGEFFRTFFELGIVGISLYSLLWLISLWKILSKIDIKEYFIGLRYHNWLRAMTLISMISIVAFEASNMLSILLFLIAPHLTTLIKPEVVGEWKIKKTRTLPVDTKGP